MEPIETTKLAAHGNRGWFSHTTDASKSGKRDDSFISRRREFFYAAQHGGRKVIGDQSYGCLCFVKWTETGPLRCAYTSLRSRWHAYSRNVLVVVLRTVSTKPHFHARKCWREKLLTTSRRYIMSVGIIEGFFGYCQSASLFAGRAYD